MLFTYLQRYIIQKKSQTQRKRRITDMGEGNKVRSEVKNNKLTDISVKTSYEGETVEHTRSSTNAEDNLPW